eukprot:10552819-Alexandrium_andersonii.AAC.1
MAYRTVAPDGAPAATPASSSSAVDTPRFRENLPTAAAAERSADPSVLLTRRPATLAKRVIEIATQAN